MHRGIRPGPRPHKPREGARVVGQAERTIGGVRMENWEIKMCVDDEELDMLMDDEGWRENIIEVRRLKAQKQESVKEKRLTGRDAILEHMAKLSTPATTKEISIATGLKYQNTWQHINKLLGENIVRELEGERYVLQEASL